MQTITWTINLFYPLIISAVCFVIYLAYSLSKLKCTNSEHSETKWILHKTFDKTIDHDERRFNKATDDLKEVAFTEAHEHEMHDMEVRLKRMEDTIKDILETLNNLTKNK